MRYRGPRLKAYLKVKDKRGRRVVVLDRGKVVTILHQLKFKAFLGNVEPITVERPHFDVKIEKCQLIKEVMT